MIGTTVAHYKITEKIGAGGMGEVFRPQAVVELPRPLWDSSFKVSPDGRRMLAVRRLEGTATRRDPVVVINWNDELEAKVPAAK